jgi:hypothetical protein
LLANSAFSRAGVKWLKPYLESKRLIRQQCTLGDVCWQAYQRVLALNSFTNNLKKL